MSGARLACLAAVALFASRGVTQAATANIEILGTGAESLLGSDLTDPENDGEDALGSATSPTWNWVEITSSHEPDFEGGENSFNIFDNKVGGGNDKWCCDDPTVDIPVWVAVKFAKQYSLTHFTVTSGNDSPDRDPTDWAIQGSNDGTTFTDIYHFTSTEVPWTDRNQVAKFTLTAASAPYSYFRYIAWETPGSLHQINEIEYFGTVGAQVDTDNDGMPDDYETSKGFNPADATDAAKDFDGDGVSNLDEYKAGTDPVDVTKPTVTAAKSAATFDTIQITFSEELDPATATVAANYTITPSLAVTAATYSKKVVTLTTAAQAPGGTGYTVAIAGVKDLSKNEVAAGTKALVYSYLLVKTGVLKISVWENIQGTPVDNLLNDPSYPASPTRTGSVFSFNSRDYIPNDSLENYGAVIEGYLTPAESGDYRFFIYSDDASVLQLSTDDKEANLLEIAVETGCCNNFTEPDSLRTSEPTALVAGRKYFIRMIYKEGGGGDYGQVAWRKEGDATPAASLLPIPGKYLSAASDLPAPAEGAFATQTPAPAAKNVSPDTKITVAHRDGKVEWTAANVTLKFDGTTVTPTFTKDGNLATISYSPGVVLASKSTHTVSLGYQDPGGLPVSLDWSFEVAEYRGPIKDTVNGYPGLLFGKADQTADKGGHSGAAGDRAMDFGARAGSVAVLDISFVNAAAANDTVSVAFFEKLGAVADSSMFWMISPKSASSERGFQAHAPWSNENVYFDTAGCCDTDLTRINKAISEFTDGGYTDATWWQSWHHFVFVKNKTAKQIWIDGLLFHEGLGNPLPNDFTRMVIGGGPGLSDNRVNGVMDDFAIFGTGLTEAQIKALASGTAPSAITGNPGLLAYWNFNDDLSAPATGPKLTVTRSGSNVTVTSDPQPMAAGFVLQTANSVAGPWTTVAGQNTPFTAPIGTGSVFLRATKP